MGHGVVKVLGGQPVGGDVAGIAPEGGGVAPEGPFHPYMAG